MTAWEAFWAAYPHKVKKTYAKRAWTRLKADAALEAAILAGLEAHCRIWEARGTERRYIPHPSTFLNQRYWEGELSAEDPPDNSRQVERRQQRVRDISEKYASQWWSFQRGIHEANERHRS